MWSRGLIFISFFFFFFRFHASIHSRPIYTGKTYGRYDLKLYTSNGALTSLLSFCLSFLFICSVWRSGRQWVNSRSALLGACPDGSGAILVQNARIGVWRVTGRDSVVIVNWFWSSYPDTTTVRLVQSAYAYIFIFFIHIHVPTSRSAGFCDYFCSYHFLLIPFPSIHLRSSSFLRWSFRIIH